ncbi:MAG: UDP-N-acetylmuramoyl-L-alanine--D-glutamate ligase [Candidatus Heteroscillospira sp.]|jgi:UDP-N-acetylmuramoylalanine--D-glutamate ligase
MTLNDYIESIRGKNIGVVGVGVSNRPLIELLAKGGCRVTACDRASRETLGDYAGTLEELGVSLRLGDGYLDDLDFDLIFRTPGMHPGNSALCRARERGAVVTSEMELFFSLCPCRTIAVTGSDGKTTTSTLIAEILKVEGYTVWLGGNIGKPLLTEIPNMNSDDFAVLELSSFQLHSMVCSPDVAVITNVSPNHLDVHPSYKDYIDAKKSVFINQRPDALLVLNADNDITRAMTGEAPGRVRTFSRRGRVDSGFYAQDGTIYQAEAGGDLAMVLTEEIRIPGQHNVENYMAAFCATQDFAGRRAWRTVVKSFLGVEHRIEFVRELDGVRYYNDSIASSPTRTIAGLRSFEQKVILIAGGYDKHIPFEPLGAEAPERVKALFLCGATADKIRAAVVSAPGYDSEKLPIFTLTDFAETVNAARAWAKPGDVILLSPACAAFDQFKNFAERGRFFKKIVGEMN